MTLELSDLVHPHEWNHRVDIKCTGMTIHSARQVLNAMGFVWWELENIGRTDKNINLYIELQNKLRNIIYTQ